MHKTARGGGRVAPNSRQRSVKELCSRAFIGLPWPMKSAGRGSGVTATHSRGRDAVTPNRLQTQNLLAHLLELVVAQASGVEHPAQAAHLLEGRGGDRHGPV